MKRLLIALSFIISHLSFSSVAAQTRRPIDNEHPLWMIHVDVWNAADPQKIIDMVPEDIRPWVCMNLSLIPISSAGTLPSSSGASTMATWARQRRWDR